jgi:hypothetical protein
MRKINENDINWFKGNNPLGKHEKIVEYDRDGSYVWFTFIGKHIIYSAYFLFEDMFGHVHKILEKDLLEQEYYIYDDTKFEEVLEKQREIILLNVKNIEESIDWLRNR